MLLTPIPCSKFCRGQFTMSPLVDKREQCSEVPAIIKIVIVVPRDPVSWTAVHENRT